MSKSFSFRNSSTNRDKSDPKSWWFPTRSTGRFEPGGGTPSKPRTTEPSSKVEKNTGDTRRRSGSTTRRRVSATVVAFGGTKSRTAFWALSKAFCFSSGA